MEIIGTSPTIDPNHLGKEEKWRLVRALYEVQCQIFQGVDIKEFANYILRPDALRTRVKIFHGGRQETVGYHAVHLFETRPRGNDIVAVFRAEAGLLRAHRRKHATLWLSFLEFCRYKCLHPRRKVYYLGTLVHPSSYHLIFRHCCEFYPTHRRETPPDVLRFMCDMARNFGIESACLANPLIVKVGWRVRNDREDLTFWSECNKPDVKYFLQTNPGFRDGEGLLTLVPITWKNLMCLLVRWTSEACRRRLRNPTWRSATVHRQKDSSSNRDAAEKDVTREESGEDRGE